MGLLLLLFCGGVVAAVVVLCFLFCFVFAVFVVILLPLSQSFCCHGLGVVHCLAVLVVNPLSLS